MGNTPTWRVHHGALLGSNIEIGDFVIIALPLHDAQRGKLKTVIGENAVIRSHTAIYEGNHIGDNFVTGHGVMIREGNETGDNVSIGSHSVLEHHSTIGHGVRIQSQAFIPEYSGIAERCWVGPNAVLTNALYPLSQRTKETPAVQFCDPMLRSVLTRLSYQAS